MFERHLSKNLREGEEILTVVRRSLLVEVWRIALAGVLILAPFFLLVPLFRNGLWGLVLFLALLLAGIILAVRTLFVWSVNAFVLTNDRIVDIDQRGFFTTGVSSANYDKIQDVSFSIRGVWRTLFRIGTVEVQTAGTDVRLELAGVKDPQAVQEQITSLVREKGATPVQASAERLIAALERTEDSAGRPIRPKTGRR